MDILFGVPIWAWGVFFVTVLVLTVFYLGVLNKKNEAISIKKSLKLSLFYISIDLILVLMGIKIVLMMIGINLSAALTLGITFALLAGGVLYSVWKTKDKPLEITD